MASSYGEDASKQALRTAYLDLPKLTPSYQARLDGDALMHLRVFSGYRDAHVVLVFPSQREEADTHGPARQAAKDGKVVAKPTFSADGTVTFYVTDDEGKRVPLDEDLFADSICLIPGLVFDAEGYRVAYAAGYIDNFLATYPGLKVAMARGVQISSNPLPHDDHDVPVDVLVSDGAVWKCRRVE